MSQASAPADLSDQIAQDLPYLRRYARALTGSQSAGDTYAVATLEAILHDRSMFDGDASVRVELFRCFHSIWRSSGSPSPDEAGSALAQTQEHLASLSKNTREALLLATVEDFSFNDIARIMDTDIATVAQLVSVARQDMKNSVSGAVMIIEDEPIIATDLTAIVTDLGHSVTGVARTRDEAVALGRSAPPALILADIQLADNSSGIDAVNDLLVDFEDTPVIFITAFPERLLTGERPEPAFLISKPYREDQVRSAVSQAMFFASTEMLQN